VVATNPRYPPGIVTGPENVAVVEKVVVLEKVLAPVHIFVELRIDVGAGKTPKAGVNADISTVEPRVDERNALNCDCTPAIPGTLTLKFHAHPLGERPTLSVVGTVTENVPPDTGTVIPLTGIMTFCEASTTAEVGVRVTVPFSPVPCKFSYVPVTIMFVSPDIGIPLLTDG